MMKIARFIIISILLLGSCKAYAGNVALDGIATASSEYYDAFYGIYKPASLAIDGDPLTNWSADAAHDGWLIVDLKSIYDIQTIVLKSLDKPEYDTLYSNYNLYSSLDNINWNLIGSGTLTDNDSEWFEVWHIGGDEMRSIKYEVTGGTHWAHLYEIEAYPTPEPSTCLLFGIGLLGAGLIKRRASTCRSSKV